MTEPTNVGRAALARFIAKILAAQLKKVLARMPSDNPMTVLWTDDFWEEQARSLEPFRTKLREVAERGARDTLNRLGFNVGQTGYIPTEEILGWIERYSFEMIGGITETSRRYVERALIKAFTTSGFTKGDFEALISPWFGPVRAEMIATTELTRAYYEGGAAAIRQVEDAGFEMVHIWNTNNDGLVCDICYPRNQTAGYGYPAGDYEYGWEDPPPAHPRCRCWVTYKLI